ncbi:helix-turn-helix domain-containing protein [Desulfitobacterium metallireducens]|uniref:XRE family transcriptional regulator n=1 Tax=Desulfitobacterium metallireducens DSM 15288 TaxID=871968 RepID=W0EAT2_9FIRM|nr:helix-turn-helix domain-containing protein [Desulfitobacterium metallireducens]AHF06638.1 XRE family transcriptional regulator [Desulfitobacterium metallireducens DSM 15288]
MAGEGKLLQIAREEKGWSIIQAEDVTKIRVRYLEAMENENYSILPGATYVKGFLRTYSKHLGINSEEVLELYKASEPVLQPKSESDLRTSTSLRRPVWFRPMVAVLVGFLAVGAVAGIASLSKQGGEVKTADYTPVPLPSAPQTEQKPASEVSPDQAQNTTPQNPPSVIAATTDGLKAQIVFTQPCWLVVNVDGKPALEGTFSLGTTKELSGAETIEFVTVGNAGGITITLNGKNVPSFGTAGQVVRNVVLNKETLNQISAQTQTGQTSQPSVQPQ